MYVSGLDATGFRLVVATNFREEVECSLEEIGNFPQLALKDKLFGEEMFVGDPRSVRETISVEGREGGDLKILEQKIETTRKSSIP